jgi:hypothetical protein
MFRFMFKICQKYVIFKSFEEVEQCFSNINNIGYNCFEVFLGIFYSLYWFQNIKIYWEYNNILKIHL